MKEKIKVCLRILDAVYRGHRTLDVYLDETEGFLIKDNGKQVFRSSSLAGCWSFIAGRYYKYGYDFDVMGYPGDLWIKSMFRSKRLNPKDYLFGGVR